MFLLGWTTPRHLVPLSGRSTEPEPRRPRPDARQHNPARHHARHQRPTALAQARLAAARGQHRPPPRRTSNPSCAARCQEAYQENRPPTPLDYDYTYGLFNMPSTSYGTIVGSLPTVTYFSNNSRLRRIIAASASSAARRSSSLSKKFDLLRLRTA